VDGPPRDRESGRRRVISRGADLARSQAHAAKPPVPARYQRPMFRGGDDGLAPVSAHVSQWNNRTYVLG
jgi:hypothetical protein